MIPTERDGEKQREARGGTKHDKRGLEEDGWKVAVVKGRAREERSVRAGQTRTIATSQRSPPAATISCDVRRFGIAEREADTRETMVHCIYICIYVFDLAMSRLHPVGQRSTSLRSDFGTCDCDDCRSGLGIHTYVETKKTDGIKASIEDEKSSFQL